MWGFFVLSSEVWLNIFKIWLFLNVLLWPYLDHSSEIFDIALSRAFYSFTLCPASHYIFKCIFTIMFLHSFPGLDIWFSALQKTKSRVWMPVCIGCGWMGCGAHGRPCTFLFFPRMLSAHLSVRSTERGGQASACRFPELVFHIEDSR